MPTADDALRGSLRAVLVVGSNGQFGTLFARRLAAQGVVVHGADRQPRAADPALLTSYAQATLPEIGPLAAVLAAVDGVVACVPEDVVVASIAGLAAAMRTDAVLSDIASVKGRVAERVASLNGTGPGYLSLHPMFGPTVDFAGRAVCLVRLRDNPRSDALAALIAGWGCATPTMSALQHDGTAAFAQAVPHALLLAFGEALAEGDVAFEALWAMSTPVGRALLALLARVARGERATYLSIQAANAAAAPARAAFSEALRTFDARVAQGHAAAFDEPLDRIMAMLATVDPELRTIGDAIVDATRERPSER